MHNDIFIYPSSDFDMHIIKYRHNMSRIYMYMFTLLY